MRVRTRREDKKRRRAARPSTARLALTLVALFAFAAQSFLTQTHVHLSAQARAAFAASQTGDGTAHASVTKQPDRRGTPVRDDPANCPICQQIAFAGHYFSPAAAILQTPTQTGAFAPPPAATTVVVAPASHAWQSRAPPIA